MRCIHCNGELNTGFVCMKCGRSSLGAHTYNPPVVHPDDRDARIAELERENAELRQLLLRYRKETPLGHQPHMIAHRVDALLSSNAQS